MRSLQQFVIALSIFFLPVVAFGQHLDTASIDQTLGRSRQKSGEVYKFSFPRTDLHVAVGGVAIKPGLALGSWAAFSGSDAKARVMGDLVLLQSEVNPVMKKLCNAGFEITAVHNHLIDENPQVMYMHYMGHGNANQLATSLHDALAESKTPLGKPVPATVDSENPPWVKTAQGAIGRQGTFKGGVLEEPRLFFMHFWGTGSADEIGAGIRAALAKVSTK